MKTKGWGKLVLVGSILCFSILWGILHLVRKSVASEGYDTYEAAWNYLVRSGEIRFRLLSGSEIKSLSSDGTDGRVVSSTEAYFKAGHGNFNTLLKYDDRSGTLITKELITSKFNNWNRVLYVENQDGSFSRYDNGVLEEKNQP